MPAEVLEFPLHRARPPRPPTTPFEAATAWILEELKGYAPDVMTMRSVALVEIERPRDALHREWALEFLERTNPYV